MGSYHNEKLNYLEKPYYLMNYTYEIRDFDAGGRIGRFKIGNKILDTPNLFPVVSPFNNLIPPKRIYEHFGAQSIFTNAYILYKNREKNLEIIQKGLHAHLDFPGIIATDSGGFQDYMYAGEIKTRPEEIEPFQEQIGSDCPVILDIPVQTTDDHTVALDKVNITLERARENIKRRQREDTAWFGPIHGSIYPDLLKKSALAMSEMEFGIYAIGGVVKTFIDYRFDLDVAIILEVRKWLRPDRPLHMFGLGLPAFFPLAVASGVDLFDSAAYILYAKDNRYFTLTGTKKLGEMNDLPCHCPICTSYTAAELRKLPKNEKIIALAEHNLYHSFSEIRSIKNAIKEGTLWDLVEHRVHAHPKFVKALRQIKKNPDYFLNQLNMNKTRGQMILSDFSFYRPHFNYFRTKMQNYKLPQSKSIIFFLPELDLPSYHNPTVKQWIKSINKLENQNKIHIILISNILGIIPIELANYYPASQHEGDLIPQEYKNIQEELTRGMMKVLTKMVTPEVKLFFLIPETFKNEYNEKETFTRENHIIDHLQKTLKTSLKIIMPSIHITEIENVEDFPDGI
ncbi:MAG: tRNA guanosine(15) transglycosylase TgtA [Promethearchaeota archaeon]